MTSILQKQQTPTMQTLPNLRIFNLGNFRNKQLTNWGGGGGGGGGFKLLTVFKGTDFLFAGKEMHNETKVVEGYCWVITHAAGRSCCRRSDSSMMKS